MPRRFHVLHFLRVIHSCSSNKLRFPLQRKGKIGKISRTPTTRFLYGLYVLCFFLVFLLVLLLLLFFFLAASLFAFVCSASSLFLALAFNKRSDLLSRSRSTRLPPFFLAFAFALLFRYFCRRLRRYCSGSIVEFFSLKKITLFSRSAPAFGVFELSLQLPPKGSLCAITRRFRAAEFKYLPDATPCSISADWHRNFEAVLEIFGAGVSVCAARLFCVPRWRKAVNGCHPVTRFCSHSTPSNWSAAKTSVVVAVAVVVVDAVAVGGVGNCWQRLWIDDVGRTRFARRLGRGEKGKKGKAIRRPRPLSFHHNPACSDRRSGHPTIRVVIKPSQCWSPPSKDRETCQEPNKKITLRNRSTTRNLRNGGLKGFDDDPRWLMGRNARLLILHQREARVEVRHTHKGKRVASGDPNAIGTSQSVAVAGRKRRPECGRVRSLFKSKRMSGRHHPNHLQNTFAAGPSRAAWLRAAINHVATRSERWKRLGKPTLVRRDGAQSKKCN